MVDTSLYTSVHTHGTYNTKMTPSVNSTLGAPHVSVSTCGLGHQEWGRLCLSGDSEISVPSGPSAANLKDKAYQDTTHIKSLLAWSLDSREPSTNLRDAAKWPWPC